MAERVLSKLRPEVRTPGLALGAVLLLAILTFATAPTTNAPPLSIHSADPDGALALWEWFNRGGYTTRAITSRAQLGEIDALFLLAPQVIYTEGDGRALRSWVVQGHTLIVAGAPLLLNTMLAPFGLSLEYLSTTADTAVPASPALNAPPFGSAPIAAFASIQSTQATFVPHLYAGDQPVVVSVGVGRGRLWLIGALRPFTNRGLRDSGNAALIANLVADLPGDAVIGFDEGAHGEAIPENMTQWLFESPPGLGVLLGFGLTLLYVASRGRRFGRAVPLPESRLRRESAEHIHAMAGLFRRAGQRGEVLKHFDGQLRRHLSERYAVDPELEAADLVSAVMYRAPQIDETTLRRLLKALSQSDVSEAELVSLVAALDRFLRSTN
jgi:hypothetical protein